MREKCRAAGGMYCPSQIKRRQGTKGAAQIFVISQVIKDELCLKRFDN